SLVARTPYALYPLFFSHRCGHRPHLPSFPTRRSSDLGACRWVSRPSVTIRSSRRQTRSRGPLLPRRLLPACLIGTLRATTRDAGDRKSTRLNSSHVKISYAVFCLKKKNPEPICRLTDT